MSLISTRCLFILVLTFLPFPTRSDGTDGFPKLDDKVKAAVEKISKEDIVKIFGVDFGSNVEPVIHCFDENATCFAADSIKNELRLRNGYKTLGEGCSADPALNQHLFSPPSIRDLVAYPIWQRHLLDANQPLCSPFKHLQCSKTTAKCECGPGLIWREELFDKHILLASKGGGTIEFRPLRDSEKICIFPMNKPCQMREYPGDEEIDSNALSPLEGIPLAEYFAIFLRVDVFGDPIRGIQGLQIQSPACGDNVCAISLYTQRQRVCAPRGWDTVSIVLEGYFPPHNRKFTAYRGPLELGFQCNYEAHRRLYTISDEELSDADFWKKRQRNLDNVPRSDKEKYCDLSGFSICRETTTTVRPFPPQLGEFEGRCECLEPFIPTNLSRTSCILPKEFNQCDMTNGLIKLLRNVTYTRGTKLLLNEGVEKSMVGVCPQNFKCHAGLDIHDEMEIYCTCPNGQAGPQCKDKLTGFLMFPRVPSFPSDADTIEEKWKYFNEFNEKAIKFEAIFKLSKGQSCDFNAEAEAFTAVEKIRRLDKKGTVMTKAQYKKLMDTLIKLTKQHQNGPGLCQRFGFRPFTCNSVNMTCVREDENIMLEACKHLADTCELEGMIVISGKCFCATIISSTAPNPPPTSDKSTKSLGVLKTTPDYFIIVGIIIITIK